MVLRLINYFHPQNSENLFIQMDLLPDFHSNDLVPVTIILTVTFGFLAYWYISLSENILRKIRQGSSSRLFLLKKVLWQRLMGVLFLGILPGLAILLLLHFNLNDLGVVFLNSGKTVGWIILLPFIIVPGSYFTPKNQQHLKNYPQIRIKNWNPALIFINIISWSLYLLAYEFLFRGVLLLGLNAIYGAWPAITINIAIYSLAHFPKGKKEALGAIPIGLTLSILTLNSGTIWIAFFAHLTMALSNDYFSIKSNPDFKFTK